MDAQHPPSDLDITGLDLWHSVTKVFDLEFHELVTLGEACRTADRLDRLADEMQDSTLTVINSKGDVTANPILIEQRQQSLVYTRLIASLRLPDEENVAPQHRGAARGVYGKLSSVG